MIPPKVKLRLMVKINFLLIGNIKCLNPTAIRIMQSVLLRVSSNEINHIYMKDLEKKINYFHSMAKSGDFPDCNKCPRNPKVNDTTYAFTCLDHFSINENGLLIIMRDPGGSPDGAARTNKLCPYCNNDKSAIKFRELLNLIIIPHSQIYFCNAVLHGYFKENKKSINKLELNCCKNVVTRIFDILTPKIVFALGIEALESSYKILANKNIKASMNLWIEKDFYFGLFNKTHLFSLPHTSFLGPNLSKYGLTTNEVFMKLSRSINSVYGK